VQCPTLAHAPALPVAVAEQKHYGLLAVLLPVLKRGDDFRVGDLCRKPIAKREPTGSVSSYGCFSWNAALWLRVVRSHQTRSDYACSGPVS
jgi:hypothetical protein